MASRSTYYADLSEFREGLSGSGTVHVYNDLESWREAYKACAPNSLTNEKALVIIDRSPTTPESPHTTD